MLNLKQIIREVLQEELICEMAISLSDYKALVNNLIEQIAQNWCLIRYVSLSGNKNELKKHWQSELKTHLNNISRRKLKKGDSVQAKEKALYSVWSENDFDTNENCIDLAIATKFEIEGIETRGKIYAQVISDFKNATKDIVNIILSESNSKIVEYVINI